MGRLVLALVSGIGLSACGGKKAASEVVSPSSDFEYELNEAGDGIVITKYTGENSVILIPQQIDGYPVVQAGGFGGENLQSVKLTDSVKIINENAFKGCSKLTGINIPANIEIIGEDAFKGCTELYNLTIPESITAIRFSMWYTYLNNESAWRDSDGGIPIDVFEDCEKLPIAVRKRLQDLGYMGVF